MTEQIIETATPAEPKVREHGILFKGDMVKAILSGRKTQTRRLVTKSTSICGSTTWDRLDLSRAFPQRSGGKLWSPLTAEASAAYGDDSTLHRVHPRCQIGNRLWVRETWYCDKEREMIYYRADGEAHEQLDASAVAWRSPRYMPRWASRITLEVVSVRVERLHEITEDDARAEGTQPIAVSVMDIPPPTDTTGASGGGHITAREVFAGLWDVINGKRASWSSNPYVWRIEFRRMP